MGSRRKAFFLSLILLLCFASGLSAITKKEARAKLRKRHLAFKNSVFTDLVSNNDKTNVKLFLIAGMNPDTPCECCGSTPIMTAASNGSRPMIQLLLDYYANLEAVNKKGENALHYACMDGRPKTAKYLIEKGLKVNSKDARGETPLFKAARNGHAKTVIFLLENGAKVNQSDVKGFTVLMAAAYSTPEIIGILLKNGADINAQIKKYKYTALMLASLKGKLDNVKCLVKHKADVNISGVEGDSALMLAASEGHADVVEFLLKNGAEIDHKGYKGLSALGSAAMQGKSDVAEVLLKHGAKVDLRNVLDFTPLDVACSRGHLDIAKVLIKYNADVNYINMIGLTPLTMACLKGNYDLVKLLLDNKAELNPKGSAGSALQAAVQTGDIKIVKLLLKYGAKPVCTNEYFGTKLNLLFDPIKSGNTELVKLLLKNGAPVNLTHDETKTFPLHIASAFGRKDIVKLLLEYKADVNAKAPNGYTPLRIVEKIISERNIRKGDYLKTGNREMDFWGTAELLKAAGGKLK